MIIENNKCIFSQKYEIEMQPDNVVRYADCWKEYTSSHPANVCAET